MFREVADLSPGARLDYFERHATPPQLRSEVESLLDFDSPTGSLNGAVRRAVASFWFGEDAPATRCGPWKVGRLLGRGGMGAVYAAERDDGEVEQRAAIKFVRDAFEAAGQHRLLAERRILASLNHPGIARFLDAGHTSAGQPWFVMEYIEGVSIDAFCSELGTGAILELFLKVCDAVSYAHRNLVIHRDLKPTNILVDASGQPRLLDFGIARLVDDATGSELTRERFLTPAYASPEQVRGAPQSTATDVYSLGAVLEHLLAKKTIPKDLTYVLDLCRREEPEQRYSSVEAMAVDIRAVLESRPVRARSGSGWYQTGKFLRRHWLPTAAVAAAVVSLGAGLFVANEERKVAEQRFQQLRRLSNKVLDLDSDVYALPGSTKVRQDIVAASLEYLEGLGREARNDPGLNLDIANGYISLARIQGLPAYANLGQFAEAGRSLTKAQTFTATVLTAHPERPDALLLAAEAEQGMMMLADSEQHRDEALEHAAACAGYLDRVVRGGKQTAEQNSDVGRLYTNVGLAYMNAHRFDDALRYAKLGFKTIDSSSIGRSDSASSLSLMANIMRQQGDLEGALKAISEARAKLETTSYASMGAKMSSFHAILWRQGLILGEVDGISLHRPDQAVEPLQKDFDTMEALAASDPNDSTSRDRLGTAGRTLGPILRLTDPSRALAVYDRSVRRLREIPHSVKARRDEAQLLAGSAGVLRDLHRVPEASARLDEALRLLAEAKDYPGKPIFPGGQVDMTLRALAEHQSEMGRREVARSTYRDLLTGIFASKPDPENDLRQANDLSHIYQALAGVSPAEEAKQLMNQRRQLWAGWEKKLPGNRFIESVR